MSKRQSRGSKGSSPQPRRYRPPLGLEYREFVGELGPANGDIVTELHVRYGVRDDKYLDWSIAVNLRKGTLTDYLGSGSYLERRRLSRVDVSESAIRRYKFDPKNPRTPPKVDVEVQLQAGDEDVVDHQYNVNMAAASRTWRARHPAAENDPHAYAVFGFAGLDRDPTFRQNRSWLRNTLVAVDSDIAEEVMVDRLAVYFPQHRNPTAAVLMPEQDIFKYMTASERPSPEQSADPRESMEVAALQITMGMAVEIANTDEDWTDRLLE
ncbi:hypothetical protein ACQPZ2_44210 (plasmid) [Nocardia pseudovaccinii]|uniref:hypothetical protein n=1 Tax=Nocardia pseudovaccinii TaxID=189540 RepID=UPI003D90BBFB